jgi:nucleoside-diphosphate kinase
MAIERTLSIIKPDGVRNNHIGEILAIFEKNGLRVAAAKLIQMSEAQAAGFYAVHKARPFFKDLVSFMISGPSLVLVLEGEGAIKKNRDLMGATNPEKADAGTIRKMFAKSIDENTVHGSDAPETAAFEIGWFFAGTEIVNGAK